MVTLVMKRREEAMKQVVNLYYIDIDTDANSTEPHASLFFSLCHILIKQSLHAFSPALSLFSFP
jgi:hypothetical protein